GEGPAGGGAPGGAGGGGPPLAAGGGGEAVALVKVLGEAADEEPRVAARLVEEERGEGARGGLAVGAGDDEGRGALEDVLGERVGHGGGAHAGGAGGGGLGVRGPADVADDDEVGPRVEVRRVEPRDEADAPPLKRGAHRGVEGDVGAGDVVAGGLEEPREGAHAGARDGDEVDVHRAGSIGQKPAGREGL